MNNRPINTPSLDSGVQYSGTGGDVFDDETRLKRDFHPDTSSAASDSTHHSIYFRGRKVPFIPQVNIDDPHYHYGNPRHAGASGQQKSDDSTSQTSDSGGLMEVLQKHLIGSRKKKKKGDVLPIIHIGKVIINPPPPRETGIYGDPIYNYHPQQEIFGPPDPCAPAHNARYMSVPDYLPGSHYTGPTPTPHLEKQPVEQGMSAPPSAQPPSVQPTGSIPGISGFHDDDDDGERSNEVDLNLASNQQVDQAANCLEEAFASYRDDTRPDFKPDAAHITAEISVRTPN